MKLGWQQLKTEFAGIKWFDRKFLRDEEELTQEEIKYIRSWTFSPFGFGNIIYIFKRVLPDVVTVYIVTSLHSVLYDPLIKPLINNEKFGWQVSLITLLISIFVSVTSLYSVYFLFRHGRRLSWNRGQYVYSGFSRGKKEMWKSVEELRESENRYIKYSAIPSLIIVLSFFFLVSVV